MTLCMLVPPPAHVLPSGRFLCCPFFPSFFVTPGVLRRLNFPLARNFFFVRFLHFSMIMFLFAVGAAQNFLMNSTVPLAPSFLLPPVSELPTLLVLGSPLFLESQLANASSSYLPHEAFFWVPQVEFVLFFRMIFGR